MFWLHRWSAGPFDGRQHTHWVIAIKAGTAAGRQCSAITKSHTILLRRKYFRGRGLECLDCREISDRRLNKLRCDTCGSSIKVKPIGPKRYLLNVLNVQNAAVGHEASFDASWFGVGVPGNGSSTPKRQQDESLDGEEHIFGLIDGVKGREFPAIRRTSPQKRRITATRAYGPAQPNR